LKLRRFAFLTLLCTWPTIVIAQVPLTKINQPIVLDGVVDEPIWDSVESLPIVQYEPVFRGGMSEESIFKVAYDESYIYVAGKLYTNNPSTITSNTLTRDQFSGDDIFAIVLDPFNDNENGLWFLTNPVGTRIDIAISNDANFGGGSNAMNRSWNTYWDVATTQDEDGWYAEMRIPFSSIGFQENDGIAEMGMIVYRWIASANERHIYPAIPPNWNMGNAKPSQAQDILLEGVQSKKPLYLTPYTIAGQNLNNKLNDAETKYLKDRDFTRELGFDVKYNLTGNLTLDVTLNTDFAQVEADDQQLNLSRFSLFFPEKRQFFQERAGLYDVSYGRNRLFYSRRIGLDSDGNPVRILGGARMTGRIGNWDIGIINMQTEETDSLTSENFGVLRMQRKTFNERSNVGGIFTSRMGRNGSKNVVYGLDKKINIHGDLYIDLLGSQTVDTEIQSEENTDFFTTTSWRVAITLQKSVGFNYRLVVNRTGEHFDPGIGYVRRTGNTDYFTRLAYGWFAPEYSIINRQNIDFVIYNQAKNDSYELLGRSIWTGWNIRFKQLGEFELDIRYNNEILLTDDDFDLLGKIYIPEGEYETYRIGANYETNEGNKFGFELGAEYGGLYDGTSFEFQINPRWIVNTRLEIGGNYTLSNIYFPDLSNRSQNDYMAHLGQFRAQFSLNKQFSASTFVQYSNVSELIGANVRFRYNFSEGRDFWLVFNEQVNTLRDELEVPRTPKLENRTLLLKYTHTFIF
jgi:hypothetical protein